MEREDVAAALREIRTAAEEVRALSASGFGKMKFQKVRTLILNLYTARQRSKIEARTSIDRFVRFFLGSLDGEIAGAVEKMAAERLREKLFVRLETLHLVCNGNHSYHLFRESKDLANAAVFAATKELGDRLPTRLGGKLRLVQNN